MASAKRPALGLELLGLGPLLEVALARVPLADHRNLGGTCKKLRRLVFGDEFARMRKTLGATEYGLLVVGSSIYFDDDEETGTDAALVCPTHDLRKLGFEKSRLERYLYLWEFATANTSDDRIVICGDSNNELDIMIYDTRTHRWVQDRWANVHDPHFPTKLPEIMYGQCTAFIDDVLVVAAGAHARDGTFSWDEQSQIWERLPSMPSAACHPGYCVIGSRLFVVGGHCDYRSKDPEMYTPGPNRFSTFTARLQIFDNNSRSWSLGPPLTALKERGETVSTAVAHNGCVYVVAQKDLDDSRLLYSIGCSSFYVYNPRAEAWSRLADLPVGPSHMSVAACVHDGSLVIAGKSMGPEYQETTFLYELNEKSGTWRRKSMLIDNVELWPRQGVASLVSFPLRLRSSFEDELVDVPDDGASDGGSYAASDGSGRW
jgi:hypothetical protein